MDNTVHFTQSQALKAPTDHLAAVARILADPISAILSVQREHPLLTIYGIGKREPFHRGDQEENFRRKREGMTNPHEVGQFIRAVQYLATRNNRETLYTGCSSYIWKHRAESWHRKRLRLTVHQQSEGYISNGMLICAALAMGFGMEPAKPWSINVLFTIGAPLVREKRSGRYGRA